MIDEYQVKRAQDDFANKAVVVLGNGKTSLDMVTVAGPVAKVAHHVFRAPRWYIPDYILGVVDYSVLLFSRSSTLFMPSWAHPTAAERFIHSSKPVLSFLVSAFWSFIGILFSMSHWLKFRQGSKGSYNAQHCPSPAGRYQATVPDIPLSFSFRSALPLVPPDYYSLLAKGKIVPHRADVASFAADALILSTGEEIPCDVVVASLGCEYPTFPFLKDEYRKYLEQEGGCQLYRHLLHPRIPNVGFAGFNRYG